MATKAADKTEKEPAPRSPSLTIPEKPEGKGDRRLFQTSPEKKEWLTEDEAKDKGFYWKPAKKS